ncbi:uncharacterized protein [Procambarus clarkii]|uniref:uncharacterized protein n=1 Tax=Procambarus clarkii TaxID=6728 RepID=UPI0037425E62
MSYSAIDSEAMSSTSAALTTQQDESPCLSPASSDYFASPASSAFDRSSTDMSCLSFPRGLHEPLPLSFSSSVVLRMRCSHSTSIPLRLPRITDSYGSSPPSTSDSCARTMSHVPYSRPRQTRNMCRRRDVIRFSDYDNCGSSHCHRALAAAAMLDSVSSTPRESRNDTSAMRCRTYRIVSRSDGAAGGASSAIYTPSAALLDTSFTSSSGNRFSFNEQDFLPLDLSSMSRSWTTSPEDQVARPASHLRQDGAPETLLGDLLALNLRDTPERPQGFLNSSHNLQKTPDSNLR